MVKIEISSTYLNFNAGHFTIFSATEREDLHGHSFYVNAEFCGAVDENGLSFDYKPAKKVLRELCRELDEKVLLPERSIYLKLGEKDGYIIAEFAGERIPFLPRDVLTLPIRNVTLEELAYYLLGRLRHDPVIEALGIHHISLRVSAGRGQSAVAETGS